MTFKIIILLKGIFTELKKIFVNKKN